MDEKKKKTLEDFMVAVPEEEIEEKEENKKVSDVITLDEPKRRVWLRVIVYILLAVLLVGLGYTGYRVYLSNTEVETTDKIQNSVTDDVASDTADSATEVLNTVYVDAEGGLNMRETATSDAAILTVIPDGTKLTIEEEDGDWVKVTYEDFTGWISKEYTKAP